MIIFHFIRLHKYKRRSKIINKNSIITFYPFFWIKDLYNVFIIIIFFILILLNSFYFNDTEIFMEKDELNRPIHIVPEWYFLFLYCILRSIPNKILGVFIFIISIFLFLILILIRNKNFNFFNKIIIFKLIIIIIILRWLGNCFVEIPYRSIGLLITLLYIKIFLLIFIINLLIF
jgi:ubiquinol-cytochrome c reductase cytochrome b subunit